MNDYLIERYSKNDLREFWSLLLEYKNALEMEQQLEKKQPPYYEGAIQSIIFCMAEVEKRFDLF